MSKKSNRVFHQKKSLISMGIFVLFLLVLPLNILSLVVMHSMLTSARESLETSISASLVTYMKDLDNRMTTSYFTLYEILSDKNTVNYLNSSSSSPQDWHYVYDRYQVYRKISEIPSISDFADGFYFDLPETDDFLYVDLASGDYLTQSNAAQTIRSLPVVDGKWHLYTNEQYTYMIRTLQTENYSYGVVVNCYNRLPQFDYKNYQLSFSCTAPEEDAHNISTSASSQNSDCVITFTWPYNEFSRHINLWVYFILASLLLFLLDAPTLAFLFQKKVCNPLKELNQAHHEILLGNEDYQISREPTSLEFTEAYDSFNTMAKTLKELRLNKINRELAYKEMQLNNLQLQIRPHFLLNMMNLLYTLVQTQQFEVSQEMILYLSQYFRYMFRNGKDLNLFAKELDLIKSYLQVSAFQHPGAFTVSYQIDPIIELIRIPPLLIHNFVENIIHHALLPNRVVHIVLFGEYDDHMVTLQISDDGRGMPKEDVDMINNRTFPESDIGKHVGIRNSITRLHYYFGEKAHVIVESCPDIGTTFSIYIPYDLEEASDEAFDCK